MTMGTVHSNADEKTATRLHRQRSIMKVNEFSSMKKLYVIILYDFLVGAGNIALGRRVSGSGDIELERVVDGSLDGNYYQNSCSRLGPSSDGKLWWAVHLSERYKIDHVKITNTEDPVHGRQVYSFWVYIYIYIYIYMYIHIYIYIYHRPRHCQRIGATVHVFNPLCFSKEKLNYNFLGEVKIPHKEIASICQLM